MAAAVYIMLLLAQLNIIFASGLVTESNTCVSDCIVYSNSYGHDLFCVDGHVVDKDLFCKVLKFHSAHRCVIEAYLAGSKCGLELSLANLSTRLGRKLLQTEVGERPSMYNPTEDEHEHKLLVTPNIAIAASGIFIFCCSLLCPCFRAKRKETDHNALVKDPSSISSIEMNSVSEKIPASPHRVPPSPRFSMSPKLSEVGAVHLNLSQILKATRSFSPSLQIGEGGFGTVYKAQLEDGQVVAIKRAKKEHFQNLRTEFSSEVELLTKIDHRNLVKLLGYVDTGNERLLITEYLPNGTLREHLDGQRNKILDFNQRLEISIDIAHALTYLHIYAEKQIIHRDVKSSNILLTESYRAKVADFGFARLGPVDSDNTHISTKVKGTVGYLDPEYMKTFRLTPKSDVYSFGVLLVEILTGRRPVDFKRAADERVTIRWAFKNYDEGNVVGIMDPSMEEVVDGEILLKMFALAIQCAAPTRSDRPDMKSVSEQLWGIRMDYLKSARRV